MQINQIHEYLWEVPPSEKKGMRVPARIYASPILMKTLDQGVIDQVTNVACLPGIVQYALCMPDGHWGYGFPIGGVAAFSIEEGVISPGGIGFDINCGMRLIRTNLMLEEVQPYLRRLVEALFKSVPSGVGGKGSVSLSRRDLEQIMVEGAGWCIRKGYGWPQDQERIEAEGKLAGADPAAVSHRAVERGIGQLGTLGSGNHYLEIQVASQIFDLPLAAQLGIVPNQVVVMVHCGSRGFGHQIGTDYLMEFDQAMKKYGIEIPDRQLACAPFISPEGQRYFKAMAAGANMAFANRQVITHQIREVFSGLFGRSPEKLGMEVVYDVAHNVAKRERHLVDGARRELLVHRKGATRAFGPGAEGVPKKYQQTGQPVIIGGSMETGSYLLVGTDRALKETFGSTLHGAGRTMSRTAAKKKIGGKELLQKMEAQGIIVRTASLSGLSEEAGEAYKNVSQVVDAVEGAGISKKVAALRPIGNIKG